VSAQPNVSARGITVLVEFLLDETGGADDLAVRVAAAIGETFGGQAGFESASLMVSADGRRMVNVARWASEADWRAATDDAQGQRPPAAPAEDPDWLARRSADRPVARILSEGGATLERVAAFHAVETVHRRTTAVVDADRPVLHEEDSEALVAVQDLVRRLQHGLDGADADVYDGTFAADVLWGTPKGMVVDGVEELLPIHRTLMAEQVAPASTFELVTWRRPAPGVAVAQIRRRAHQDGQFSEVAVYTLVRRGQRWWVAAAQNTPVVAAQ
jgi:uncharacterized protein (TIGR02246 family)